MRWRPSAHGPLVTALALVASGAGPAHSAVAQVSGQALPVYRDLVDAPTGDTPFAVIGDLQQTLPVERYLLMRESNPAERLALVRGLEAARPDFLIIVGDLTSNGSSEKQWQFFDRLMDKMRAFELPIVPVVGNHDYWGDREQAVRQLVARFPPLGRSTWYTRTYGRLALVVLDANVSVLSAGQWQAQEAWLRETLERLDADPAIAGVLVFTHQPPFTNSTVTRDDPAVQAAFLPAFRHSRKTLAMISGHTHAYEHFVEDGKHFIVTGGGGGPRVSLYTGRGQRHLDLFIGPAPRPFHFLWMTPETWGVRVEVRGLDKGQTNLRTIDQFDLRW
jgi:predicted phosphodiesterase